MALQYALRMDYVDADKACLSEFLSKYATKFFVVHETAQGENPHIHAMFDSATKLASLRMAFKRTFPNKIGNGAYSLKECDDDVEAYMRYMCKGDSVEDLPVVILRQGLDFDDEAVKLAHDAYWVNNAALNSNKRKRSDLKEAGTVVEKVEKKCKELGVSSSDRVGIAKIYIKMYRDARKPINSFAAKAVVNTVQLLLDDSDRYVDELAGMIAA